MHDIDVVLPDESGEQNSITGEANGPEEVLEDGGQRIEVLRRREVKLVYLDIVVRPDCLVKPPGCLGNDNDVLYSGIVIEIF